MGLKGSECLFCHDSFTGKLVGKEGNNFTVNKESLEEFKRNCKRFKVKLVVAGNEGKWKQLALCYLCKDAYQCMVQLQMQVKELEALVRKFEDILRKRVPGNVAEKLTTNCEALNLREENEIKKPDDDSAEVMHKDLMQLSETTATETATAIKLECQPPFEDNIEDNHNLDWSDNPEHASPSEQSRDNSDNSDSDYNPGKSDKAPPSLSKNSGEPFPRHSKRSRARSKRPEACHICDKVLHGRLAYLQHYAEEHPKEKRYTCKFCQRWFQRRILCLVHQRTHTGERPFSCQFCDKSFRNLPCLKVHVKTVHENIGKPPTESEYWMFCTLCKRGFQHKANFCKHNKRVHAGKATCTAPTKDLNSEALKALGVSCITRRKCHICWEPIVTMAFVSKHFEEKHPDHVPGPLVCQCGKIFKNYSDVQKHAVRHTQHKSFQCDQCPAAFYLDWELKKHNKIHHSVPGERLKTVHKKNSKSPPEPKLQDVLRTNVSAGVADEKQDSNLELNTTGSKFVERNVIQKPKLDSESNEIPATLRKNKDAIQLSNTTAADAVEIEASIKIEFQPPRVDNVEVSHNLELSNPPTSPASPGPVEESCGSDSDSDYNPDNSFNDPAPPNKKQRASGETLPSPSRLKRTKPRLNRPVACHICDKVLHGRMAFLKHYADDHPNEKRYTCKFCQRWFQRRYLCLVHQRTHTGERPFSCSFCDKSFGDVNRRNVHVKTVHENIRKPPTKSEYWMFCTLCKKGFQHKTNFRRHNKKVHAGKAGCTAPTKDLNSEALETLGVSNITRRKCHICWEPIVTMGFVSKHFEEKHPDHTPGPLVCQCGKIFKNYSDVQKHAVRHTQHKSFQCDQCPAAFYLDWELKKHNHNHHSAPGERLLHVCDICGLQLTSITGLKYHKVKHEQNQRRWVCDHCGKDYAEKKGLQYHIKSEHLKIHAYKCEVEGCGQSFVGRCDLTRHTRKHFDERPFKCEHCERSFGFNCSLKRHVREVHDSKGRKERKRKRTEGTSGVDVKEEVVGF